MFVIHPNVRSLTLAAVLTSLALLAAFAGAEARAAEARAALPAILEKFDHVPLVAFGMSHWQQNEADAVLALVRSPGFAAKVGNIVIEDGNALYQDRLDRYIDGEDVPLDQLRAVWQNTTQPGRGDAPQHRALLEAVRQLNRTQPAARRIRVLAGDPPIDWDRVRTPEDIRPFVTVRDSFFASVVADQVLARGRKALLVIGAGHVLRHGMSFAGVAADPAPTITNLIESGHPHAVYVIDPHEGFGSRTGELEARASRWPRPALCDLGGSWVGDVDASLVFTGKVMRVGMDPRHPAAAYPGLKLRDLADGFLYLGPIDSIRRVSWAAEEGTAHAAVVGRRDALMMELDRAATGAAPRQALPVRR